LGPPELDARRLSSRHAGAIVGAIRWPDRHDHRRVDGVTAFTPTSDARSAQKRSQDTCAEQTCQRQRATSTPR
jgi:hypothetical protein